MDLSLILLNTFCGMYPIQKESKYTVAINNGTQCAPLLFLSLRFIAYAPSFILGKLSLEKNIIKPRIKIEILSNLNIA